MTEHGPRGAHGIMTMFTCEDEVPARDADFNHGHHSLGHCGRRGVVIGPDHIMAIIISLIGWVRADYRILKPGLTEPIGCRRVALAASACLARSVCPRLGGVLLLP